jgi:hypothetical protein
MLPTLSGRGARLWRLCINVICRLLLCHDKKTGEPSILDKHIDKRGFVTVSCGREDERCSRWLLVVSVSLECGYSALALTMLQRTAT